MLEDLLAQGWHISNIFQVGTHPNHSWEVYMRRGTNAYAKGTGDTIEAALESAVANEIIPPAIERPTTLVSQARVSIMSILGLTKPITRRF